MNRLRVLPPLGVIAMIGPAVFSVWLNSDEDEIVPTPTSDIQFNETDEKNHVEKRLLELANVANVDAVFQERPLFIEGRQVPVIEEVQFETAPIVQTPEPEVTAPPPPPPPIPPEIELAGIAVDASGSRALIRSLADGTEAWMTEGQPIGEWTLAEISQVEVRLSAGGTEIAFKLFPDTLP